MRVLILGANGFIGSALTAAILQRTDWEVAAMDLGGNRLAEFVGHERLTFFEGDITVERDWIEEQVKWADVVLPLVAIANPIQYVRDPLRVFELDFEANLAVVRQCVRHRKRIVFPSTSEVYGMSPEAEVDEASSALVYGPIERQRWIYACSKQLLDRVIYAYGERDGIDYTLFRPFNWIGPHLDNVFAAGEGSSRLFTQFISNILFEKPLQLVDGGQQSRSFTYIDDGVDALLRIIANHGGCASRQIFNLGNPANNVSVARLAQMLIAAVAEYPEFAGQAARAKVVHTTAQEYFGRSYQDIQRRVPSIARAKKHLGWMPRVDLATAIKLTLDHHLTHAESRLE